MIQLDSGVLTRLCQKDHRDHATAAACVLNLHAQKESVGLVSQNLFEFWTVATRPKTAAEGLGMTPARAKLQIENFLATYSLQFVDDQSLFRQWTRLVETYGCAGKAAHDARIVAAMNVLGVTRLLTFNPRDFNRYTPAISLLDPAQLATRRP